MIDKNPYRTLHARMSPPGAAWDEGFAAGRAAATPRCDACDEPFDGQCAACRAEDDARHPQDEFDGAGCCPEEDGFLRAKARAAATPDPPTDERRPWPIAPDAVMPPRRQPVRWGSRADDVPTEIHDDPQRTKAYLAGLAAGRTEAAAASPDERLREALERIVDLPLVDDSDADRMREIAAEALPWKPGSDDPR